MIEKLLSIATVGSAFANAGILQRLIVDVTKLMALTIITAIMGCTLLIGLFTGIYYSLIHFGLEPFAAAATLIGFMFLLTLLLIAFTVTRLRQMRSVHFVQLHRDIPGLSRIVGIGEAFIDGFLCHKTSAKR